MKQFTKRTSVWKYYLRPWTKRGYLYSLQNHHANQINLKDISEKRSLYSIVDLTADEMQSLERNLSEKSSPVLRFMGINWVETLSMLFRIKQKVIEGGKYDQNRKEEIARVLSSFEQEFYDTVENRSYYYLECLKNKRTAFYYNGSDNLNFKLFLCINLAKTKSKKNKILKRFIESDDSLFTICNDWSVLKLISILQSSSTFFSRADEWNITLLVNKTTDLYITGDQPVVNVSLIDKITSNNLALYYPISPILAILINNQNKHHNNNIVEISNDEIRFYNNLIKQYSVREIYSCNEEGMKPII